LSTGRKAPAPASFLITSSTGRGWNRREEHTHLGVAASVAAGSARAGLGILPAARAFGLDFVPLCEERYDLLMSASFYRSAAGEALLGLIADTAFKKRVEAMGGYSMRDAGKLMS